MVFHCVLCLVVWVGNVSTKQHRQHTEHILTKSVLASSASHHGLFPVYQKGTRVSEGLGLSDLGYRRLGFRVAGVWVHGFVVGVWILPDLG